jgi:hypothetical protein
MMMTSFVTLNDRRDENHSHQAKFPLNNTGQSISLKEYKEKWMNKRKRKKEGKHTGNTARPPRPSIECLYSGVVKSVLLQIKCVE